MDRKDNTANEERTKCPSGGLDGNEGMEAYQADEETRIPEPAETEALDQVDEDTIIDPGSASKNWTSG